TYSWGSEVPGQLSSGNCMMSPRILWVPVEDADGAGPAVDFDIVAVKNCSCRTRNCHYCWDTEHPAGYRGVGDHAATLDNESRGVEHQRQPAGIGFAGNENSPHAILRPGIGIQHQFRATADDARARRKTYQHGAGASCRRRIFGTA